MKSSLLAIVVFVSAVFGSVMSGSLHQGDARYLNNLLTGAGYDVDVLITDRSGETDLAIYFSGDYFDLMEDGDKVGAVAAAVGEVTKSTSWSSFAAIMIFEDTVVGIPTASCREMLQMADEGATADVIGPYLMRETYVIDRSSTNW